ncbi:MAG: tRNA 2-thiouridine(34) synthase MnmA [Campylobacteraceae bacterium]|nr:tRNA 2-thiouridine(34) synthase MnmA [Campylobacteraceae bacterium]
MAKILVALSGGVDSTITALRLKQQGHELLGCYMKLHGKESYHEENIQKVKKVASFLGIDYKILDLSDKFFKEVYSPFIEVYKAGKTPNPCVACNKNIKFGALVEFAKKSGMDKLATGHYVRIKDGFIAEAKDMSKDQSYFLANVKKQAIQYMMFPLGDSFKEDVKKQASLIEELNLFATQKESSEICFVDDTYVEILREHLKVDNEGDVLDVDGNIIGSHRGYMHYTVGKRRGFEVRGAHEPHYVLSINPQNNTIVVGKKDDLTQREFKITDINPFMDEKKLTCKVKIRYRSPKIPCFVDLDSGKVTLKEDASGIASGQRAVFYDDDKVIASGEIV